MTFQIDVGTIEEALARAKQYDGNVTFRGFATRADRKTRQIIAAIECCETPDEVEQTLIEEDLIVDALMMDYPYMFESIKQAADDHKAILEAGMSSFNDTGAPVAMTPTAQTNVLNKTF